MLCQKFYSSLFIFHYIIQGGGGSGLGLWITRGIVDLHEGKISVFSSGEGEGTGFKHYTHSVR